MPLGSTALSLPTVRGQFFEGVASTDLSQTLELISQVVTGVKSPFGQYGWWSDLPRPKERAGDRSATKLAARKLTIENVAYNNSVEFDEYDVEVDETGDTVRKVQELGAGWEEWKFETNVDLLHNGANADAIAWDGKRFYAPDGERHFVNDLTATEVAKLGVVNPDAVTPEEFPEVLLGIVQHMLGFTDTKGKMIHRSAKRFAVGVPTGMFSSAMTGVHANSLAGGQTNPVANLATRGYEFHVYADARYNNNPRTLHVSRADRIGSRATITQEFHPIRISYMGEGSEHTELTGMHRVNTRYAGGFGYGSPANSARGTLG